MKFKPGELVEVEKDRMRFEMIDGKWVPNTNRIFGTVVRVGRLHRKITNTWEGIQSQQMYDVLIDGKIEVKVEHLLTSIKES